MLNKPFMQESHIAVLSFTLHGLYVAHHERTKNQYAPLLFPRIYKFSWALNLKTSPISIDRLLHLTRRGIFRVVDIYSHDNYILRRGWMFQVGTKHNSMDVKENEYMSKRSVLLVEYPPDIPRKRMQSLKRASVVEG